MKVTKITVKINLICFESSHKKGIFAPNLLQIK